MQINLHAPFLLTQCLLPLLRQSIEGHIIFTTDKVAQEHQAYFGAYAIAKAGIEAFSGLLHQESEANTKLVIHTVYPGKIATRLRKRNYPDIDTSLLTSPEAIAHAYVYLLSQQGAASKGEALSISI
jgi:NAD(P)-dependent dehydrogenase (short-subunit alcohol dehydrogenase family)